MERHQYYQTISTTKKQICQNLRIMIDNKANLRQVFDKYISNKHLLQISQKNWR